MSEVFDQLESQLRQAVRSRRPSRPWWVRRGHRRMTALAIIITLIAAGGALAAGGVLQISVHAGSQQNLLGMTACMRVSGLPSYPEPKNGRVELTAAHINVLSPVYRHAVVHCENAVANGQFNSLDP